MRVLYSINHSPIRRQTARTASKPVAFSCLFRLFPLTLQPMMKQLIILLCLVVLLPVGVRAQEDHDIAASLNLNEVVVLADGMTFEEYLVKQVLENAKPLKKRS